MLLGVELLLFVALAFGVAWYFVGHEHGQRKPLASLWLAALFGVGGAIAAGVLEIALLPASTLNQQNYTVHSLLFFLGLAAIEEVCKFVPLAIFLWRKDYFNEYADGVIFFAIAGLGFGVPENLLYAVGSGTKVGLLRLIFTPLFHAATTAIVGYYLAKAKIEGRSLKKTGLALGLMILAHGAYNFGVLSRSIAGAALSLVITVTLTGLLFAYYFRASKDDKNMDQAIGSAQKFCRNCGQPNAKHERYCTHCGRHA
jgi:RsiW-degrading membrane proteinase PrsW (M82 family)